MCIACCVLAAPQKATEHLPGLRQLGCFRLGVPLILHATAVQMCIFCQGNWQFLHLMYLCPSGAEFACMQRHCSSTNCADTLLLHFVGASQHTLAMTTSHGRRRAAWSMTVSMPRCVCPLYYLNSIWQGLQYCLSILRCYTLFHRCPLKIMPVRGACPKQEGEGFVSAWVGGVEATCMFDTLSHEWRTDAYVTFSAALGKPWTPG